MGSLTTLLRRTAWRPQTTGESQRCPSHARRLELPSARGLLEASRLQAEGGLRLRACMSGLGTGSPHRQMSVTGCWAYDSGARVAALCLRPRGAWRRAANAIGEWSVVLNTMRRPAARRPRLPGAQCLHQRRRSRRNAPQCLCEAAGFMPPTSTRGRQKQPTYASSAVSARRDASDHRRHSGESMSLGMGVLQDGRWNDYVSARYYQEVRDELTTC
jgi:hypothetical protein